MALGATDIVRKRIRKSCKRLFLPTQVLRCSENRIVRKQTEHHHTCRAIWESNKKSIVIEEEFLIILRKFQIKQFFNSEI